MSRQFTPLNHDHTGGGSGGSEISPRKINGFVGMSPDDNFQGRVNEAEEKGVALVFTETGKYDIGEIGTATVNEPIPIIMPGNGQSDNFFANQWVENIGADAVDSPILTVANPTVGTFADRPVGAQIINFAAIHEGTTSPAIKVDDATLTRIDRPFIDCRNAGYGGVQFANETALGVVRDAQVRRFVGTGIDLSGTGGALWLENPNLNGDGNAGTTCIEAGQHCTINGGQVTNSDIGINVTAKGVGIISNYLETAGTGIVFNEGTGPDESVARDCWFVGMSDYCIDFQNTTNSKVLNPLNLPDGSTSTHAVRFGASSVRNAVAGSFKTLSDSSYDIVVGATQPTVQFDPLPVLADTNRTGIVQAVEGMRIYNSTDGNLNIYNGTDWILPSGTIT